LKSVIPNVTPGQHIVPTVLYYIGGVSDVLSLSGRVAERLLEYTDLGIVTTVVPYTTTEYSVQSLPQYDQWITPLNAQKWAFHRGAGVVTTPLSELRVVIIATEATVDVSEINAIREHTIQSYSNHGISTISISFIGITDAPIALDSSTYTSILCVSSRVLDRQATAENLIVSFVGSALPTWLADKGTQLASGGKKVRATWVGAASVYVDAATIIKVVRDNLTILFMKLWRSESLDQSQAIAVKSAAVHEVQRTKASIARDVLNAVTAHGWVFTESSSPTSIASTQMGDPTPSGYLAQNAGVAQRLFGVASIWWVSATQSSTSVTKVFSDFRAFWSGFNTAPELEVVAEEQLVAALESHYSDISAASRGVVQEQFEVRMQSLTDFLMVQMFPPTSKDDRHYGIQRLIEALNFLIDESAKPLQFTFGGVQINSSYVDTHEYRAFMAKTNTALIYDAQRKIARLRRSVMSPIGLGVRMLAVYPIIVALIGMYGVILGTSTLTWVIAALALILLTFYEWFRSYNAYARSASEIRTQLFQRQLAPSVLSIASSVAESERARIHTNLMRLREVYQDLNTLINQGVLKPIPVVSNREVPSKYVFQKLSRALGDEEIVVDSSYSGEPWDLLAGERVRVYRKNQVYQLSWIGLIKYQLNSEARNRNSALPARAEVMLLERIAQRVFEQQRQATTAMSYLRSIIEEPIAGVAGKDPVQIEVLVEEAAALSGGKKWAWLAQNALVNVVPRVVAPGMTQTASELVILSQTSQDLLDAATGRNSTYWRQPEAILTSALEHEVTKIHVEFDIQ
jgi:hypothetical protein